MEIKDLVKNSNVRILTYIKQLLIITQEYKTPIGGCNGFDCGLKFGEAIREEQRYHSKLNINAEDNLAYAAQLQLPNLAYSSVKIRYRLDGKRYMQSFEHIGVL